jgi:hypothetical protein
MPVKRSGRFKNGWFTVLAVFLVSSLAAGCVQGVHSAGEREGPVEDPLTGERLVTVRIPVNTAARALTAAQAQGGIDFCEVVFKHKEDGRIFSASATKDNELSIVLPVGTYETVLLAGIYNSNTLLASAYQDKVKVVIDTARIPYELKALDASVYNVEIKEVGYDTQAPFPLDGMTSEGFPYFSSLGRGGCFAAAITIGNFLDAAIFDPVLKADREIEDFRDAIEKVVSYASQDILRVLAPFEADLAAIVAAGDYFEGGGTLTDNELEALADLCPGLAGRISLLVDSFQNLLGGEKNLQASIATAKDVNYANAAAAKAWEAADFLSGALAYSPNEKVGDANKTPWGFLAEAMAEYLRLFEKMKGGNSWTSDRTAELASIRALMAQGPEYPSVAELQAVFAAVKAAGAATSGLSAGSLPGAVEGARSVTLPFAAGWVDLDVPSHVTVNVLFATPRQTGFAKLYFDFAFKAFGGSQVHTWHIKQGLDNYAVDDGTGRGGSILLSVVPPPAPGNP